MTVRITAEIRDARLDDLPRLTEIYNHYVTQTPITFDVEPFTVEDRRAWFDEHPAVGPHRLLVAIDDGVVAGYATSSSFRQKRAYETSVETSVYCAPEATGRRLGAALYERLFHVLKTEDVHRAYAGVALPNDASVSLHGRFDFRQIGIYQEVGCKFGRYWDVMWFEKRLGD